MSQEASSAQGAGPQNTHTRAVSVGRTSPQSSQHASSPASANGVEWADFRKEVLAVRNLIGSASIQNQWEESILLALSEHWLEESLEVQSTLLQRVKDHRERIKKIKAGSRKGCINFIFDGRLPPLQQLILDLPLCRRTMSSDVMSNGLRWFPFVARSWILSEAKTQFEQLIPLPGDYENLFNTYWWAYEQAVAQLEGNHLASAALLDLSRHFTDRWSELVTEQRKCAITTFLTLERYFIDIRRHEVVDPRLLGLWIPKPEQAQTVLQEIWREMFSNHGFCIPSVSPAYHHSSLQSPRTSPPRQPSTSPDPSQLNHPHLGYSGGTGHSLSFARSPLSRRRRKLYGFE